MQFTSFTLLAFLGGGAAILYAIVKSIWILRQPMEHETLKKISGYIATGARTFLLTEYSVLLPFVLVIAGFLALGQEGILRFQSLSFLLGALCSGAAGFIGMYIATSANGRTTHAAQQGIESM
ncbi:MAG: sodium/proton-translocating pyrophosphatase, partial [Spirochaetales bacterium]